MTPRQRQRVRELLDEYSAIKRAVLTPIEEIEPCLASPRSSLHPERLAQIALSDEVRDGELAKKAKRESYREAEDKQ